MPFAAVIVSRYRDKWVLCKNKVRGKWEVPGGHREENETILETAKRELFEETGAKVFEITPICPYSLSRYAMLFYAEITEFGDLPELEIERIGLFSELPEDDELTFPELHAALVEKVKAVMNIEWKKGRVNYGCNIYHSKNYSQTCYCPEYGRLY